MIISGQPGATATILATGTDGTILIERRPAQYFFYQFRLRATA